MNARVSSARAAFSKESRLEFPRQSSADRSPPSARPEDTLSPTKFGSSRCPSCSEDVFSLQQLTIHFLGGDTPRFLFLDPTCPLPLHLRKNEAPNAGRPAAHTPHCACRSCSNGLCKRLVANDAQLVHTSRVAVESPGAGTGVLTTTMQSPLQYHTPLRPPPRRRGARWRCAAAYFLHAPCARACAPRPPRARGPRPAGAAGARRPRALRWRYTPPRPA